jgi:mRNA-degrading endonuclease RelE of RelBE toxin-antitoxin system
MTSTKFKKVLLRPEFQKDIRKLSKRFRTLADDLKIFVETAVYLYHKLNIDNNGIFHIPGLGFSTPRIFKAKKFACRALKGSGANSGIRVIYSYNEKEDIIEFVEIYFKSDQENEDKQRIKRIYC